MVCANGAIIRCPGLFDGEMIVMVESSSRAIVVAMNATDPNTWHAVSVFNKLVQKNFAQCTQAEQKERQAAANTSFCDTLLDIDNQQETLCSECLKMSFFGGLLETKQIGVFRENRNVS